MMFRQRLQEQEVVGGNADWFVSRVCELPVVNSAVGQLTGLYCGVKQHNRLFRLTLDTAEGGVKVVVNTARPVVAKFDKPIGALNTIACQQLDKLEHDFPILTKPTDEVLKETKQLCDNAVKPLVDRVAAVKQYGVDKVAGVKSYTTDKINGVKTYSVNTLSTVSELSTKQFTKVLDMSVCQQVVSKLDTALDIADHYVDTYLPQGEDEKKCESTSISNERTLVICKARNIGSKVRRRMYARLAGQLRTVQLRSTETISHFKFTVNLIEYSRGRLTSARDKALYVWTEVNKSEEDVAKEMTDEAAETRLHSDSTFERKAIATARHLTQKTKHAMTSVGLPLDGLPDVIYNRLKVVHDAKQFVINSMKLPSSVDLHGTNMNLYHIVSEYQKMFQQKWTTTVHWVVNIEQVKTVTPSCIMKFVSCTEEPSTVCGDTVHKDSGDLSEDIPVSSSRDDDDDKENSHHSD
jgi:hypothetical protein